MNYDCPNDPTLHCLMRPPNSLFSGPQHCFVGKGYSVSSFTEKPRVGHDMVERQLETRDLREPGISLSMQEVRPMSGMLKRSEHLPHWKPDPNSYEIRRLWKPSAQMCVRRGEKVTTADVWMGVCQLALVGLTSKCSWALKTWENSVYQGQNEKYNEGEMLQLLRILILSQFF